MPAGLETTVPFPSPSTVSVKENWSTGPASRPPVSPDPASRPLLLPTVLPAEASRPPVGPSGGRELRALVPLQPANTVQTATSLHPTRKRIRNPLLKVRWFLL